MKLLNLTITNNNTLKITIKKPKLMRLDTTIKHLTKNLNATDLQYKYLGFYLDIKGNIVLMFRLLDLENDIKPYID